MRPLILDLAIHHGVQHFAQLGIISTVCRSLRDEIKYSKDVWQNTAQNMTRSREKLSKTAAHKIFMLSKKDLEDIQYESKPLGWGRSVHLCDPQSVFEIAIRKHGSMEQMELYRQRREKRILTLRETRKRKAEEIQAGQSKRRRELTEALQNNGLPLRKDSFLCRSYIDEGIGDIPAIVEKMEEMHWLHGFGDEFRNLKRKYVDDARMDSGYIPEEDWKILLETAHESAASAMVDKYGGRGTGAPRALVERLRASTG